MMMMMMICCIIIDFSIAFQIIVSISSVNLIILVFRVLVTQICKLPSNTTGKLTQMYLIIADIEFLASARSAIVKENISVLWRGYLKKIKRNKKQITHQNQSKKLLAHIMQVRYNQECAWNAVSEHISLKKKKPHT